MEFKMRFLTCFTTFALVGLLIADPVPHKEHEPFLVTLDFYKDEMVIYRGKHDIVKILVPINSLNFDESDSNESESIEDDSDIFLFFVEAEEQPDGTRQDKGLYVFKEGKATKILANGRDAAASGDDSKIVFFGAADGIYVYNKTTNSADKYGPITDSIIAIATEQPGDVLYILTENREVFKVSGNGGKKEKLDDVVNAKEIVLDKTDHLYFVSVDNKPYVRRTYGINPIIGLPEHLSNVKLIKPPFFLNDEVAFLANNRVYFISNYGSSTMSEIEFKPEAKPTAYAPEALIQYYGFDNKIYEFRISSLREDATPEELLSNYLNSKAFDNRTYCFDNQKSGVAN
ncbi:uncharacterized protein LOC123878197 [Maniola jurtina]|uniref:uncharacterized protein LOC123878197 n=1 Tax=Maniola jurtina TaxID=191418 RepID=UPI001E6889F9|nr:uncharacterized protein LOC123878197 [Maniola jurtina]